MVTKRALKALERERAERQAKRDAVWRALWADKVYCRVHARMQRWNERISECLAYPRLHTAEDLANARLRFKLASRMMHRLEHAALERAGLNPCE